MPRITMAAGTQPTFIGPIMASGKDLKPRKSLGQHWLKDEKALAQITGLASLDPEDTVLEIGPGTGILTKPLCSKVKQVIAVELDVKLADHLESLKLPNLKVVNQDILTYNFDSLPGYKIVANIPYYLTGKLIKLISETTNRPSSVVLLVQKEIADRLSAAPGKLSVLGLTCQYFWHVDLGPLVTADKFTPPPKVDSQIVKLMPKDITSSLEDRQDLFRLIKIGFSSKRKTILNNLSAGCGLSKEETKRILVAAKIEPNARPQSLSLSVWQILADELTNP